MTNDPSTDIATATKELLRRTALLVGDDAEQFDDLLIDDALETMPPARARRFYEQLAELLANHEGIRIVSEDRDRLGGAVRELIDAASQYTVLELTERNGLFVRSVSPVPQFNGITVPMTEGFVDVASIRLWAENPRSELHTVQFRERHGRLPTAEELLGLMTGEIRLPGAKAADPFALKPLARSIARKGVEQPIIVTDDGIILDGNRRFGATQVIMSDREFEIGDRERARWVRVWKLTEGATDDQKLAVVNSLNFEPELKLPWPEFVKARRVTAEYDQLRRERGQHARLTESAEREVRREVAKGFAITIQEVTRYVRMVRWADDFQSYHAEEEAREDAGKVRHRTNEIFQWFYELDAGKQGEKLTNLLEGDEDLRSVVYDLMYDVLDSGAQVRSLHKVVPDSEAFQKLREAHRLRLHGEGDEEERRALALTAVKEAIDDANGRRKARARSKSAFDEFLRTAVDRLGEATPNDWSKIDADLLKEMLRVCRAATGTIEGRLAADGLLFAKDAA